MPRTLAPYLRRWIQDEQDKTVTGFYRRTRRSREWGMKLLLLVILSALAAALWTDHHHRQAMARYRALPSADERVLSGDYPVTRVDWFQEQDRILKEQFKVR